MASGASFVRTHTAGNSVVLAATVAFTIAAGGSQAGNLLVAFVGFDNDTANTPVVSSISTPAGETAVWKKRIGVTSATATAGGSVCGEMWEIRTTVDWAAATTVTVTLSNSEVAKAVVCQEFTGVLRSQRGIVGATNQGSAAATSVTGNGFFVGSLAVGCSVMESNVAPTADTDTVNGTWDAGTTSIANVGAVATSCSVRMQYKIITATGSQTYDKSDAVDGGACIFGFEPDIPPPPLTRRAAIQRAASY